MLEWLESSALALAVRDSLPATAGLSGVHVVGMVLAAGAAVTRGLHGSDRSFTRAVRLGLCLSLCSGVLLVMPRAVSAAANPYFRAKMLTLAAAMTIDLVAFGATGQRAASAPVRGFAAALWFGVAALGCAYILFE